MQTNWILFEVNTYLVIWFQFKIRCLLRVSGITMDVYWGVMLCFASLFFLFIALTSLVILLAFQVSKSKGIIDHIFHMPHRDEMLSTGQRCVIIPSNTIVSYFLRCSLIHCILKACSEFVDL